VRSGPDQHPDSITSCANRQYCPKQDWVWYGHTTLGALTDHDQREIAERGRRPDLRVAGLAEQVVLEWVAVCIVQS